MKSLWNSFVVAFSMYSKIPMPRADWNKENMKYSMCFFPWVGLVIGALELGWFYLAVWMELGDIFRRWRSPEASIWTGFWIRRTP